MTDVSTDTVSSSPFVIVSKGARKAQIISAKITKHLHFEKGKGWTDKAGNKYDLP